MQKFLKATVLVIDGGGRGSALVEKYSQSDHVKKLLAIPGNDLMQSLTKKPVKTFPFLKTTDISKILVIAKKEKADLIDVAQDNAVAAGLVNHLKNAGFKVLGPTKEAGQIEWDKAWAREFMKRHNLPIPKYKICKKVKEGLEFIKNNKEGKWYIKASGLAAGKGALFARNKKAALGGIENMKLFGTAGKTYLIEECLQGEEFSSYALVSNESFVVIGHAQDHKTVFDGDLGPNTGGMGCTSTPLIITSEIEKQINSIFLKTVKGLVKERRPYIGVLYLGGIIDKNRKVKIIEFNARWGDPEAQVIVPKIKNDLFEVAQKTINAKLSNLKIETDDLYRVVVTCASRGYPGDYSQATGKQIFGLENLLSSKEITIFGAGTKVQNNNYITHGGRLFYVMTEGKNVLEARKKVYDAMSSLYIENNLGHFRTDIGYRDVARFFKTI